MDAKMQRIFKTRNRAVKDAELGKITPTQLWKTLQSTWDEMDMFDKLVDHSECVRQLDVI